MGVTASQCNFWNWSGAWNMTGTASGERSQDFSFRVRMILPREVGSVEARVLPWRSVIWAALTLADRAMAATTRSKESGWGSARASERREDICRAWLSRRRCMRCAISECCWRRSRSVKMPTTMISKRTRAAMNWPRIDRGLRIGIGGNTRFGHELFCDEQEARDRFLPAGLQGFSVILHPGQLACG